MAKISHRQIEAFRAVMLAGSMTAAAEFLSITQPAVSRLIQDLEATVGLLLFERRANHLIPTRDAVALATEVDRSFVGLHKIEEFVRSMRSQKSGSLRIAAMPAFATEVIPRFIGSFLRDRPAVQITLKGFNSIAVAEAVTSGEVDFGYLVGPIDRPGFEVQKIDGAAVIAMKSVHRLSAKAVVTPQDLIGEHVIGSFENLFQARIDVALAGIDRVVRVETRLSHIACVLASEGVGISFVDPFMVSHFLPQGVIARPFVPEIACDYCLLLSQKRPPTPLADTFISQFRQHLANLRRDVLAGVPNDGQRRRRR